MTPLARVRVWLGRLLMRWAFWCLTGRCAAVHCVTREQEAKEYEA